MDDAETAEVLALVAALDPFGEKIPVDDVQVDAWTLALSEVDGDLAKRAVINWYRTTGRRISIADVISGAKDVETIDRAALRAEQLRQRHLADQAALPPAGEARDRIRDIAGLLAQHRNWPLVGDLATRRKQASWSPALQRAYRQALADKAREQSDHE